MTLALALLAVAIAIGMLLLALPVGGGPVSPLARLRARELFMSKLSETERRWWERDRRLTIVGSGGGRYTLMPYEAFNIRTGDDVYCLRVLGRLPAYDRLLAQRLLIESDEKAFLAIANRRRIRP